MPAKAVLQIQGLKTSFATPRGSLRVLDGVNLEVFEGETVGLVGESGSGKTVTGLSVIRLLPRAARIVGGQILFNGQDLLTKTDAEMTRIRGREISMVLQDPMTALDPVLTLKDQMTETLRAEDGLAARPAFSKAVELLTRFRIADPAAKMGGYAHQLSGGMRQRVVSAIAISRDPKVLIADEPTTALDATLQLQYLRLLKLVQAETGVAVIFVTHDLGIVRSMCDRVAVMYAGRIVETGATDEVLSRPSHPYTEGLLGALPSPLEKLDVLPTIRGEPPNLEHLPPGCSFEPRCPYAFARCVEHYPPEFATPSGGMARCWRLDESG